MLVMIVAICKNTPPTVPDADAAHHPHLDHHRRPSTPARTLVITA
jgi:hypothetical protein